MRKCVALDILFIGPPEEKVLWLFVRALYPTDVNFAFWNNMLRTTYITRNKLQCPMVYQLLLSYIKRDKGSKEMKRKIRRHATSVFTFFSFLSFSEDGCLLRNPGFLVVLLFPASLLSENFTRDQRYSLHLLYLILLELREDEERTSFSENCFEIHLCYPHYHKFKNCFYVQNWRNSLWNSKLNFFLT